MITVNGFLVSWKAGKQSFVTLSVMEAELYEASQTSILLEHVGVLLDELVGSRVQRLLRVDNSSAVSMLTGGQGSWRTRHLKVRCAFVREQVEQSLLVIEHVDGLHQLADLATKLHPKARLLELLSQWGFTGMVQQSEGTTQLKIVYVICLLLLLSATPVQAADDQAPTPTRNVQVAGWDEVTFVAALVCVAAVAVWEAAKAVVRWALFSEREQRRGDRLRRLRRKAAEAIRRELDRAGDGVGSGSSDDSVADAEARGSADPLPSTPARRRAQDPTPPPSPQPEGPAATTAAPQAPQQETFPALDVGERARVARDVLMLFTTEELKDALRKEGLQVSGLKQDLVRRLQPLLEAARSQEGDERPTTPQIKCVLWLWRHQHLHGRVHLRWDIIGKKSMISAFIEQWKP